MKVPKGEGSFSCKRDSLGLVHVKCNRCQVEESFVTVEGLVDFTKDHLDCEEIENGSSNQSPT